MGVRAVKSEEHSDITSVLSLALSFEQRVLTVDQSGMPAPCLHLWAMAAPLLRFCARSPVIAFVNVSVVDSFINLTRRRPQGGLRPSTFRRDDTCPIPVSGTRGF